MTDSGTRRNPVLGIIMKIGCPLLVGLITLVAADISGMPARDALVLTAVVTLGFLLILFMVDTEVRVSAMDERMNEGFAKLGKSAELSAMMERSVLGSELLTGFMETASRADGRVNPLLTGLAQREIERFTSFLQQVASGSEIAYDGEDRDWLLGLTRGTKHSIDAISLSTVDAGMRGFDGGLWTSDLGIRYLELQREAIKRNVSIRRIFVFEDEVLSRDETFLRITELQRKVGVDVRMLDYQTIPDLLRPMIFDFILFDDVVSYETTPAATFSAGRTRPTIVRTLLTPRPDRIHDLKGQFEQLWDAADPEGPFPRR
jgi:hypothetical protein